MRLKRSETKFNCEAEMIIGDDVGILLVDWATRLGIRELVTAYTPTGPTYETLEHARPALEQAGINLTYVKRNYDSICWPHATKGFFKLKAKIPNLLEELGLR